MTGDQAAGTTSDFTPEAIPGAAPEATPGTAPEATPGTTPQAASGTIPERAGGPVTVDSPAWADAPPPISEARISDASTADAFTSDAAVTDASTPDAAITVAPLTATAAALSDGEWHRLHPASPLLKGGLFLLAIMGFLIANARERLIEFFVPEAGYRQEDPIYLLVESGLIGWAALAAFAVLLIIVLAFYVSWRMHTFRITDEVVEVRSGVLFRTNRKARLDRIQGINIQRPFFARLFGASRLEVSQAGNDANVKLEYLASSAAEDLRHEILRRASGTRRASVVRQTDEAGSIVERRVNDFLAPELDPNAAEPDSIVRMTAGRLIGSILLSGFSVWIVLIGIAAVVGSSFQEEIGFVGLVPLIPGAIGVASFYIQRFTKSLRFSIAGTPDGLRVGFGLLSTSSETLPPGRIHSIQITQPLLWRMPGWWEIKVNRASHSSTGGAAGQQNTTLLPVGTLDDVRRVLALVLPDLVEVEELAVRGLTAKGAAGGFTASPRRASVVRWLSWRRNGFALADAAVLLRTGAIWRSLVIVPHARMQSVSVEQGPVLRMLRLAAVHAHTVSGPISATLGALDRDDALRFFDEVARAAIRSSDRDSTHRWRSGEEPVPAVAPAVSMPVPVTAPAPSPVAMPALAPAPAPENTTP